MINKGILALLVIVFATTSSATALQTADFAEHTAQNNITRSEIQQLFKQNKHNYSHSTDWDAKFLNKSVDWKGKIFSIQYQKDFHRTEVTMKLLKRTIMYDTVVYVPGDITNLFKGEEEISFSGVISRGVDLLGVREVQIDIRANNKDHFGGLVFSENGIVNVTYLK